MNLLQKSLLLTSCLLSFTLNVYAAHATPDATLSQRVIINLAKSKNVPLSEIATHTYKGDVALCGFVNATEKRATLIAIKKVAGINNVYDNLILRSSIDKTKTSPSARQTMNDAWVTTKIKQKLLTSSNVSGTAISVETYKGNVLLCGYLDSVAEIQLAVHIARNTKGVVQVINGLRVKKI